MIDRGDVESFRSALADALNRETIVLFDLVAPHILCKIEDLSYFDYFENIFVEAVTAIAQRHEDFERERIWAFAAGHTHNGTRISFLMEHLKDKIAGKMFIIQLYSNTSTSNRGNVYQFFATDEDDLLLLNMILS
jgi:hypothetical protein